MKNLDAERRWQRLGRLLEPIHERALGTARNLCRSPADGDDLYQETVLRAFHKLHTLRDEARFRSWFFAVLLSVHRSRARRSFWRRFLPLDEAPAGDPGLTGEDGQSREGELLAARRVARALSRLPAAQREAVVLHELEGFSMEEVAAMQNASVSAVKSRVLRGRERLRKHYEALGWGKPSPADDNAPRRKTRPARDAFSGTDPLQPAYSPGDTNISTGRTS